MMHITYVASTEQIVWSEGFAIGIAEVDQQHRALLTLLDEVRGLVADRRHPDQQQRLAGVLDQLNEYAGYHFLTEETLLRQHLPKHPGTAAHIQAHRSYSSAIAGYQHQLHNGDPNICNESYRFLSQ